MSTIKKSATKDMTRGNIALLLIGFAVPLIMGNLFQMFYNTVDSVVVGKFVSTAALAAVGSTTMIVNMLVFFFNGVSVGAGVVISRYFGARDYKNLHEAVETTMLLTFVFGILFTFLGIACVNPMLRFMSTPEDVMSDAITYLRIYFAGISGLLIYNMGSGILRAVGDTKRPLYFLIFTSLVNVILDLIFVLLFHAGIAGAAYATIVAQFISALLILRLLSATRDVYYLSFKDLHFNRRILADILKIGLPTGIQSTITSFSNVFVQSYINFFGSACMAGWSCYNKLDQFIMLPMQSIAQAATTFVGQNIGAQEEDRVNRGTVQSLFIAASFTTFVAGLLFLFASPATSIFTNDPKVILFSALFIRTNVFFLIANCINHVLAGALRGRGDSAGPVVIMLLSFVALRQIYLYVMAHYISNTAKWIGFGYPVGWSTCCILEVSYFFIRWGRRSNGSTRTVPAVSDGSF